MKDCSLIDDLMDILNEANHQQLPAQEVVYVLLLLAAHVAYKTAPAPKRAREYLLECLKDMCLTNEGCKNES